MLTGQNFGNTTVRDSDCKKGCDVYFRYGHKYKLEQRAWKYKILEGSGGETDVPPGRFGRSMVCNNETRER